MKIWNKLSLNSKYYLISFLNLSICWGILSLCGVDFVNVIFFLTAFIWHFALLTPGLKEQVFTTHHKLSFLAVVIRINHYLQMFINLNRIPYAAPYATSVVRAISPALFTFLLFVVGGTGNILFTFLGSICFEVIYVVIKKKTSILEEHKGDQDIDSTILNVKKTHE